MEAKVTVGQKLYEPNRRRDGYIEYEVASIGRKWIQLKPDARCTFDLLRDCGGYAPQRLYASVEKYEADRKLSAAWADLRRDLQGSACPDGMTVEEINSIRAKLGLQVINPGAEA